MDFSSISSWDGHGPAMLTVALKYSTLARIPFSFAQPTTARNLIMTQLLDTTQRNRKQLKAIYTFPTEVVLHYSSPSGEPLCPHFKVAFFHSVFSFSDFSLGVFFS